MDFNSYATPFSNGFNQNMMSGQFDGPYSQGCMNSQNTCNVVNKVMYEDIEHPCNHHTHVVNTCVKRHFIVPSYTTSEETVYVDECCGVKNRPFGNLF